MIQAVVFDLFETLVTEAEVSPRRASSLASFLGLPETAYRREWRARRADIVLGRCSFRQALSDIAKVLGAPADDVVLDSIVTQRLEQKRTVLSRPAPELLAVLASLRAEGLSLGVLSNCFPEDMAAWQVSPLHRYFDAGVFSCAVGMAKPDPAIYLLACELLRVPPARALFVGDGADGELLGAEAAGLKALSAAWFRRPGAGGDEAAHRCLGRVEDVLNAAKAV
jgi:putative hydrolase of the HAD superfamily